MDKCNNPAHCRFEATKDMKRTRHDHEGHDDLGDHVEDGVGAHLEGNGERGETLREEPHNGVADPGEDREPGKLAVELRQLPTLSVSVSLENLREVHDHGEERREADEEPEPLDSGHHRDGAHVAGGHVNGCIIVSRHAHRTGCT